MAATSPRPAPSSAAPAARLSAARARPGCASRRAGAWWRPTSACWHSEARFHFPYDRSMSTRRSSINKKAETTPAAPANLAEHVYARIKQEMHDFAIVPGDRLSEAEIGMRLGVSRTPVREAL